MKEIKARKWECRVGTEVYSMRYISLRESEEVQEELKELAEKYDEKEQAKEYNKAIMEYIKEKMVSLGLNEKFFTLDEVTAADIYESWQDINSVKK